MIGPVGLHEEIATGGVAKPLHTKIGDRYGELVVEEKLGTRRTGNLWLLRCDCGKTAIRTSARLNQAARSGTMQCCCECTIELRSGKRIERGDFWTWYFRKYGNVWPMSSIERLERHVAEDLEKDNHLPPDRLWTDGPQEFWRDGIKKKASFQQRMAELYPLHVRPGTCFECFECKQLVTRSFGCERCIEPVCVQCVASQRHGHESEDGSTLRELGIRFELSIERIRGILAKALGKLAHPSRLYKIERPIEQRESDVVILENVILSFLKEDKLSYAEIAKQCGVSTKKVRDIDEHRWWRKKRGDYLP